MALLVLQYLGLVKFHGVTYHLKIDPSGVPDKIPSGLYAKLSDGQRDASNVLMYARVPYSVRYFPDINNASVNAALSLGVVSAADISPPPASASASVASSSPPPPPAWVHQNSALQAQVAHLTQLVGAQAYSTGGVYPAVYQQLPQMQQQQLMQHQQYQYHMQQQQL